LLVWRKRKEHHPLLTNSLTKTNITVSLFTITGNNIPTDNYTDASLVQLATELWIGCELRWQLVTSETYLKKLERKSNSLIGSNVGVGMDLYSHHSSKQHSIIEIIPHHGRCKLIGLSSHLLVTISTSPPYDCWNEIDWRTLLFQTS
jgi:hypothetical protein